jgi:hypothetical protein
VFQTKVLAFGKVTILGHAMAQAVSWWPLTTEAQVCAQVSPYGIYGGQSIDETGISPSCLVFPCNIIPLSLSKLIYHLGDMQ